MEKSKKDKAYQDLRINQYKNLRECFNENLVEPILGKDYYNMGQCVYSSDRLATEDIRFEYFSLKQDFECCKRLCIVISVFSAIQTTIFLILK